MVENSRLVATKAALAAAPGFPSAPRAPSSSSSCCPPAGTRLVPSGLPSSASGLPPGGLRLEAVMENLQRAQAARLEEKLRRRAQGGQPGGGGDGGGGSLALAHSHTHHPHQPRLLHQPLGALKALATPQEEEEEEGGEDEDEDDGEDGEDEGDEEPKPQAVPSNAAAGAPGPLALRPAALASPPVQDLMPPPAPTQPHEWTYEEQFKQLYELDSDPKRKEFLDDLFGFMQKRGTPVNRIPIMAKQVLDLYTLYRLVTEKGGLVEVINKKIWREITKGLNLPTSITSAAFTLRTQYMKYLYPYECDKRGLSSPGELQAAIDSNRREGRRQTFGTALFNYSPVGTPGGVLSSPKIPMPSLTISTHNCNQISQVHAIKKEDSILSSAVSSRLAIPVTLTGHHLVAAQAAASQAVALEHLREKLETGEPPEKKMALVAEEQQRLVQQALQQNLLAMASQFPVNIKINNRADDRQEAALNLSTNGISSINMSIEINGVVYTGVLFARRSGIPGSTASTHSHISPVTSQSQLLSTASRGHTPSSTSP
ncbi:AT-rich interactive domain-containing protein 3C [Sceloporus undulatus]|uniref:AT-rich interactive domain-containing protein 3C n=1 Tax=Sceloporus undulatus TaxID=8520 RepID=UPI001C4BB6AC|nr:AT-rich interactive domain-containing protein 3C [Sceloporus undulatus]